MPCQARPDLVAAFHGLSVANVSDNLHRAVGAVGLRPFHSGAPLAGTAFTLRTRAGDNAVIHEALDLARPGDVLVIDGGGDISRALIGEIMMTLAARRGMAGFVIDGAVRDSDALARSDFPVYARAAIHLGPYKAGPGEINVPIAVGGMVVHPGDLVIGDADGVAAFPTSIAEDLLARALAQAEREAEILARIDAGTYVSGYR
ncbi:MAG: methyltransferase [Rhodovulum sulfidophilum]|uniref:Putative 4-hydroxy-4-methyl-2-oxoglutarate aldolase n=1 Tax=Rhodovulum sulfidophilum TaxID=35806 RepID=A0A2W5MWY4_RHOSU|nr:MAG: methyltransferase [Rhodovulum sulfidophilum]